MIVSEVPESGLEVISVSLTLLRRGGKNHKLSCLGHRLVCMEDPRQGRLTISLIIGTGFLVNALLQTP